MPLLNTHIPPHYLSVSSRSGVPPPVSPTAILPNPPSNVPIPHSGQYSKLTYLPVLLKTLSRAMPEWPLFGSSITPQASLSPSSPPQKLTLTTQPGGDISIALSIPTGLYSYDPERLCTPRLLGVDSQTSFLPPCLPLPLCSPLLNRIPPASGLEAGSQPRPRWTRSPTTTRSITIAPRLT